MTRLTGEDNGGYALHETGGSSYVKQAVWICMVGYSTGVAPLQAGTASGGSCSATAGSTAPSPPLNLQTRFPAGLKLGEP